MANTTSATQECSVVAVFDRPETADRVRDELIRSGYHPNKIRGTSSGATRGGGFWDSIRELFGVTDVSEYEAAERGGRALVVVDGPDDQGWINRTNQILQRYAPIELSEQPGRTQGGGRATGAAGRTISGEGGTRIPVAQEELHVGARRVVTGGVRIYSRVYQVPVEKEVELTDERVRVERRPVDAPAGPEAFREGTIEATETREEPVVRKEARTTEEVVVRKEAEKRRERVRGEVRKQKVEAERVESDEPLEENRRDESEP